MEKALKDAEIYNAVLQGLSRGEQLHPDFAEGQYQALSYLEEELGEVAREVTKGRPGWEKRMQVELVDLIVVAWRMLRGEWK
ncbi:MAG: hypothetical protein IJT59_07115 [Desulfovibrionaceae bacterium]|nr:hypothetical protein [Desulfovibrionaceae bacterium]